MFGTLFWKECKQVLKSMVYYLYVAVFVLFLSSQLGSEMTDGMEQPVPGQDYYGTTVTHDPSAVMASTLASLVSETGWNSYATYPMGFIRSVTLNETELAEIKGIIEDCTGKSWEELVQEEEEHFSGYDQDTMEGAINAQVRYEVVPKETLGYEEFCAYMEKASEIIGAGSSYSKESLGRGVSVPMTYEQAAEEFEALCSKDRVTGATARLFCDYAGIILSVLPIFLGVTRCLRDKRAKVAQVVFAHEASSGQILGSRYLASLSMAFLPVLVTAFVMQMPYQYHAKTIGVTPDVLAFLKYTCIWLLPEVMAVLAISFLITEVTENVISIFVQVFWAVGSLFAASGLRGDFGLQLICRWNTLGSTNAFWGQRAEFLLNRGFYAGLAVLAFALTIVIYGKKRREGETIYGKIFKHRK